MRRVENTVGHCFPDERIANNEAAKFWLLVMNNLRNPDVQDTLIAVVPSRACKNHCRARDAVNAAFPDTTVQTCIMRRVRHSLTFCGWKDRKNVTKDLKWVYSIA